MLQKLQLEGLFSFKNLPDTQHQKSARKNRRSQAPFTSQDAAFAKLNQLSSFGDQSGSPEDSDKKHSASTTQSEDLMGSRSTKASLMSSSHTGTLMGAKSSTLSVSSPTLNQGKSSLGLHVIQEELQVEEGCENELEGQRVTLQLIRQGKKF